MSKRRASVAAVSVIALAIAASGISFLLRAQPAVQQFIATYPGTSLPLPQAPVGIPVWLNVTHFLNSLFLLLIIRTALLIRSKKRPPAFWTPHESIAGQAPRRVSIHVWLHNTIDALWVVNGLVYVILLFATGQWMRTVPTSWDVIPNAVSAGLQYFTFSWPVENPWVTYNALQVLSYFGVTFILAPLAILTGVRLSQAWPLDSPRLNRWVPEKPLRRIHNWVLFLFMAFIVVHVGLVLFTGAVYNLNVMYAARSEVSWIGTVIFMGSLVVMAGVWFGLAPGVQKKLAGLTGSIRH